MSRSKKHNNIERITLKKENEALKTIIKNLNIKIKKLEKEFNIKVEKLEVLETEEKGTKKTKCPKCSVGNLIESSLGIKHMVSCSEKCGYRLLAKNG